MNKKIINAVVFQAGWFVCIMLGTTLAITFTVAALLLHIVYITEPSRRRFEACFITVVLLAGAMVETAYLLGGVLVKTSGGSLPFGWLLMLWLLFATTLNHSLSWLVSKPWLAGLLTAVSAPWSYYAGVHLNSSVEFGLSPLLSLSIISLTWAALLFIIYRYLANYYLKKRANNG